MAGEKKSGAGGASCGDRVRAEDPGRFLVSLFASDAVRPALWGVYALDLELKQIRDRVTEPMMGLIRLQWWRDSIARIYEGKGAARHEVLEAIGAAVAAHALVFQDFEDLLAVREHDFEAGASVGASFESCAELEAVLSAATAPWVRMALCCTGGRVSEPDMNRICTAWALLEHIRKAPFAGNKGQNPFPREIMEDASGGAGWNKAAIVLGARAAQLLRGLEARPSDPVLWAMIRLSWQYVRQIKGVGGDVFSPRLAVLPAFSALRLWAGQLF